MVQYTVCRCLRLFRAYALFLFYSILWYYLAGFVVHIRILNEIHEYMQIMRFQVLPRDEARLIIC